MKHFRCSVWGEIEVSELALSIIDTWEMQRLHYIKQTGFAYKVFPTATSSRFEHSIGVYHVTKEIILVLEKNMPFSERLPERKKELISIVSLIHDLGHGPYSHLFDTFLENYPNPGISKEHETRSCDIFRQMVPKYHLQFSKDEVNWICNRILCPPYDMWYDTLVYNPYSSFDTDKLDYLIRDAKHFGYQCSFDFDRIMKNIRIIHDRLCFCERIQNNVEQLFTMRDDMHQSIYRHPTIQKFDEKFLTMLTHSNIVLESMDDFLQLTDQSILDRIPWKERISFETRQWPEFATQKSIHYSDFQKKLAMENLPWFSRKNPTKYFFRSEF